MIKFNLSNLLIIKRQIHNGMEIQVRGSFWVIVINSYSTSLCILGFFNSKVCWPICLLQKLQLIPMYNHKFLIHEKTQHSNLNRVFTRVVSMMARREKTKMFFGARINTCDCSICEIWGWDCSICVIWGSTFPKDLPWGIVMWDVAPFT